MARNAFKWFTIFGKSFEIYLLIKWPVMAGESFKIYFSEIAFYENRSRIIIRALWSKIIPTLTLTLILAFLGNAYNPDREDMQP